jgi:hypothetical protein
MDATDVATARELEVDASDAIRLILQFLRENRLVGAMRALQEESQVSLNAVESVDALAGDISHGRWDRVLQQAKALECSAAAMMDLYELVALDLMEAQERDVAVQLLRSTPALAAMKQTQPERYLRLERLAHKAIFDPAEAYAGSTKQKRRDDVAQVFRNEVSTVEPSRLLVLLGQALKWQQLQVKEVVGVDVVRQGRLTVWWCFTAAVCRVWWRLERTSICSEEQPRRRWWTAPRSWCASQRARSSSARHQCPNAHSLAVMGGCS